MFSVFRGTKYDDIRPNHTKKQQQKKQQQNNNNKKPTRMVFDFLWTEQGTFLVPQFHSQILLNDFDFWQFSIPRGYVRVYGKLRNIGFFGCFLFVFV